MSQRALGRLFDFVPAAADSVWTSLRDAGGVTFLCYLGGAAGDTYTVTQAKDAAGTGAKNLTVVTNYWTAKGDGSDQWVAQTQAAAATVTTTATAAQQAAVFEIEGTSLDDTFAYVKVTSTGAGLVTAVLRDLMTQRTPALLPARGV
jgi:hypothetical protein